MVQEFDFNMMKISEIIKRVTQICRSLHVVRLDLFGSFATGTATSRSDVDFVVYGEVDHEALEEAVEKIDTLRKIDLSCKIMKDILVKYMGILDFAVGSPREVLQTAFSNGIIESDMWLEMLRARNQLAHDYDGELAKKYFERISVEFYPLLVKLQERVRKYYEEPCLRETMTFYTKG